MLEPAPIKIELIFPKHFRGVQADTPTIPTAEIKTNLKLRFDDSLSPFNMPVVIRATTLSDGGPVIAEDKLELVADLQADVNSADLASTRETVGANQPDTVVQPGP